MRKKMAVWTLLTSLAFSTIPLTAVQAAPTTAKVEASVSFRTEPDTSSHVMRYLKSGEEIVILEKVNDYWLRIQVQTGQVGYISANDQYTNYTGGQASVGNTSTGARGTRSVEAVISAGKRYLGTPYEFGSSRDTTRTFDCSDFVRQAFKDGLNLKLPADSRGQGDYVKARGSYKRQWGQLKRGDLVFFMSYKGSKASSYAGINKSAQRITHVGIYLGNGQVMHTYSKEAGGVRVDSIQGKHWEYRMIFGGSAI
ncbi:hydrolase Nlp/P60 [Paenibacillus swuensis]|uniref:Hydrolase Nlp/P60 n=1 Tax=Paenibacillus swuensis TaxID=1178515 RepID=A0A172TEY3_9BACL|nr:C40 family peptidase [Paenibacillus swuensis]ANE45570.1 hydrolase Nlp/P60 [Paenibacillus swuensis]